MTNTASPSDASAGKPGDFLTIGIGASAGGLEALESFFGAVPAGCGMAFVVISHLSPGHVSLLPELLGRTTAMEVVEIADGMTVARDHVYVLPPGKDLSMMGGVLLLFDTTTPRGVNLPIDTFLRALAQDQGANAGCVVLSGTGADGAVGLKAIKEAGGVVLVQDEASAAYESMPRQAAATGLADYVLPPHEMPARLVKYRDLALRGVRIGGAPDASEHPAALAKVHALLRARTGHDFSSYKTNTICRRIERRMNVHHINDFATYVDLLRSNDAETGLLFKDLLIGVTNFFRDPEAFECLRDEILPAALEKKLPGRTFRVWVPGCSTGEEAYSVAIILRECMEAVAERFEVQIFATDIDTDAIETARLGHYPASISVDVSEDRLTRYFERTDDGFRIRKQIREMIVFAPQNVIKDPPFTKLDLLCCRNLLIYLDQHLQQKLLPLFHYSLLPGGTLFLGSSETVGRFTDLFEPLKKSWRIYATRAAVLAERPPMTFPPIRRAEGAERSENVVPAAPSEQLAVDISRAILEETGTPPCAIVDPEGCIVYVHGATRKFFELPEGQVSTNILDLVRPTLREALASSTRAARLHGRRVVRRDLPLAENEDLGTVDLVVKPLTGGRSLAGLVMVLFEQGDPVRTQEPTSEPTPAAGEPADTVEALREELHRTKDRLQTTIEEMESSNEELQSTNEELQSTNEELQSANEELETSKEELHSLNEEAASVNAELQRHIEGLSQINDDMKNLLQAAQVATVFLDIELRVRLFTPRCTELFPLEEADVGRPLAHFVSSLEIGSLAEQAQQVLDDLEKRVIETNSRDGRCFLVRIMPYRTSSNVIDGVVLTFDDISERKRMETALRESETGWRSLSETSPDDVILVDKQGGVLCANRARWAVDSRAEMVGRNLFDQLPEAGRADARACLARVLASGEPDAYVIEERRPDGSQMVVETRVGPVFSGEVIVALTCNVRDVSEQ